MTGHVPFDQHSVLGSTPNPRMGLPAGHGHHPATMRNALTSSSVDQVTPILQTKLYMPRTRPHLTPRHRLITQLCDGMDGKLTLVSAPAGFGKTTVLVEWLRVVECPVAWLSLDEHDSEPSIFLRYFIAALQTMAPDLGAPTHVLLHSLHPPPLESLLTTLINDLAALPQRTILVLDDFHTVQTPVINRALSFLLDHMPNALHLVIATRVDPMLPLARLRARG